MTPINKPIGYRTAHTFLIFMKINYHYYSTRLFVYNKHTTIGTPVVLNKT